MGLSLVQSPRLRHGSSVPQQLTHPNQPIQESRVITVVIYTSTWEKRRVSNDQKKGHKFYLQITPL